MHHLFDDMPGTHRYPSSLEALLPAAGAMTALCVMLFALLVVM
jgi:hypothetical protein